jgi:RNA polymerase sigma factor (TIGR02999 family)
MTSVPNTDSTSLAQGGFRLEGPRLAAVYEAWRQLARRFVRGERAGLTIGATDMAQHAFLDLQSATFRDTHHALAAGAQAMRRLLISHARRRMAIKRGAGATHVPMVAESGGDLAAPAGGFGGGSETYLGALIDLDDALKDLERLSERLHQVVELRYFGGYSVEDVAAATGRSEPSVKRDWARARAFLLTRLAEPPAPGGAG